MLKAALNPHNDDDECGDHALQSIVLLWITDKQRRDVVPQKAKQQEWFNTMFGMLRKKGKNNSHSQLLLVNTYYGDIQFTIFDQQ